MKRLFALAPVLILLAGCNSASSVPFATQYATLSPDLKTMGRAQPDARFLDHQPTAVTAEILSDGSSILVVQYDQIWDGPFDLNPASKPELVFSGQSAGECIAAIDKYLASLRSAIEREGTFETDLAQVPTWPAPRAAASLKFAVYGQSGVAHLLGVSFCLDVGGKQESRRPVLFDAANAGKLKKLLLDFQSGKINYTPVAAGGPNPFPSAPWASPATPDSQ